MAEQLLTLDQSSDLLAKAFARLEQAARKAAVRPIGTVDTTLLENECEALRGEMDEMRDENNALRQQLQQLQQDYVALQQLNEHIAAQIDREVEQLELLA